ncbi:MAG: flagellar biosynthetic protein FliR [Kiloniellales bacterium]|nr:flagellar biosynthetic protein FliR [Kiloniellales bacterium]
MLADLLPAGIFAVLLVFVRVGASLSLLPAFGEAYVTPRLRLVVALVIALLLAPVLAEQLPPMPTQPAALLLLILGEALVGIFLGTLARMFMSALTTAGMVIAYMSSLANALVNDPTAEQQGSIAGSFLSVTALLLIITLDLHHMLLIAVIDSYGLFAPGVAPPLGDFSDLMARTVAKTFLLAIQIATPFIAVGSIFYLGLGLLARLMPQAQILFIAMPLQVMVGISMLALAVPATLGWFIASFEDTFLPFVAPR